MCLCAAGDVPGSERERCGGADGDALLEETLSPALGHHPLGGAGGRNHEEHGDEAAREGDNLGMWREM